MDEERLSTPIILNPDGRVLDGNHRVAKAMLERHRTIKAVRIIEMPEPDFVGPLGTSG